VPGYSDVSGQTLPQGTSNFNGVRQGATGTHHAYQAPVPGTEIVNPASWSPTVALDASSGRSVLYSDDFNRADSATGGMGSNWTDYSPGYRILANRATKIANDHRVDWATALPSSDHWVEADVVNPDTGGTTFLVLHARGAANLTWYSAYIMPGVRYELGRDIAAGYTTLNSVNDAAAPAAAKIRLEVEGTSIRMYVDGVLKVSATDSGITTGTLVGFNCQTPTSDFITYDNFATGLLNVGMGTSTATGDLTVTHPVAGAMAGQSDGTSATSATLTAADALVGTSTGVATTTGALSVARSFAGRSDGSTGAPVTAVLLEPFDSLSAWTITAGTPSIVAGGRTGNGARLVGVSDSVDYPIPAVSESATITVGFALFQTLNTATSDFMWFRSDAGATDHIRIRVSASGVISALRGGVSLGGGFTNSAANAIVINTWQYVEVQVVLADSGGSVTVRVNGVVVASGTGLDTKNAGTKTTIDTFRLTGIGSLATTTYDDLYLDTGAGSAFKGDLSLPLAGITGALTVSRNLAGQADGLAATTGALAVAEGLVGTIPGTATTTGILAVATGFVGTSAGTSATTGALVVAEGLFGSTTGASTTTGALSVAKSLASSAAGASTATGALAVATGLVGTSAGLAATAGAVVVATGLVGTTAGSATVTGRLTATEALVGASAGSAAATGVLVILSSGMSALASGTSTATAALGAALALAATAAGVATTTGTLTTTAPTGPQFKAWNGSGFVTATVKVWNGSAFVAGVAAKTWNGSAFT
jgi:hypothetical protein